jgi:segregation and condensation protein A
MQAIDTPNEDDPDPFQDDRPDYAADYADEGSRQLVLDLDGYEGPIDTLLTLARDQKVDLSKISILALADQYLAFVTNMRQLQLEIAADYLVMAAWLAYLKSRLLLPPPAGDEEPCGAELATMLRFQLQRLEAMQKAGKQLLDRPRLGRDVFARGMPETFPLDKRFVVDVSLYDILRGYANQRSRNSATTLHIAPMELFSMEQALTRLTGMVADVPNWTSLFSFLPAELQDGSVGRSMLASTFAASLELVRQGRAEIRQAGPFAPIYLRAVSAGSRGQGA